MQIVSYVTLMRSQDLHVQLLLVYLIGLFDCKNPEISQCTFSV